MAHRYSFKRHDTGDVVEVVAESPQEAAAELGLAPGDSTLLGSVDLEPQVVLAPELGTHWFGTPIYNPEA